jgi:hypothetical protein
MGASGSGAPTGKQTALKTDITGIQEEIPEQEMGDDTEHTPPTRAEAVTTFIAEPLLPEPDKLIMGHISALMALAAGDEGSTYKQVVKLLSMEYDPPTANLIWET